MNSARIISFCASLESQLDACLFRSADDDKRKSVSTGAIATGAAGVTAAGGAVLGHRKIMKTYGAGGNATPMEAYRYAGRDAARTVRDSAQSSVDAARGAADNARQRATAGMQAGRVSWGRNSAQGKGLLTKIKRAGRAFVGQAGMRR